LNTVDEIIVLGVVVFEELFHLHGGMEEFHYLDDVIVYHTVEQDMSWAFDSPIRLIGPLA